MVDFDAVFFSKYNPPEALLQNVKVAKMHEDDPSDASVQILVNKNTFLQSFTIHDDKECEFLAKFDLENLIGKLILIKSREFMMIEAHVPFEIS